MIKPSISPLASRVERPLPEAVRAFLVESERRILSHCDRLLARKNLPDDERQRLHRLASAAAQEIKRLAGRDVVNAA